MSVKVYFIESSDIYGDIGFCGGVGFFSEADADKFERDQVEKNLVGMSYMVNELTVNYSHRNGETEQPTEKGYYWVIYEGFKQPVVDWCNGDGAWAHKMGQHSAKFFGPIPVPE